MSNDDYTPKKLEDKPLCFNCGERPGIKEFDGICFICKWEEVV